MTLATDLACDLGHQFPRSNLEIAISTKYLTWSQKNKKGLIPWMVWYFVNNIWPTFCFHHMLQCRSSVRACNWNLMHNVRQTGAMHWCMDEKFAKGQSLPKKGPMCKSKYDHTLLQRKIISKDLDSSREPTQWSRRGRDRNHTLVSTSALWRSGYNIAHPCRLQAFKCNVNYQNQSNFADI